MEPTFTGNCDKFKPNSDFNGCLYYDPMSNTTHNGFCKLPDMYRCVSTLSKIIPLSYSSVSDFLVCHRLYYLKAIRGIQIKKPMLSAPLKMGTLWDKVLQNHLGSKITNDKGLLCTIPDIINEYEIDDMSIAKVKGVFRAYKALDIQVEQGGNLQTKITLSINFDKVWGDNSPVTMDVTGFYDRKYPTYFVENKLSGKPEFYLDPYFIQSQIGTYFLADLSLEYCIMEVVRTPQLKQSGKFKDEDADGFCERIYQDAISRPSHYFIGWNSERKTYGKKYYRAEFNLDEIKSRYLHIFREIFNARIYEDGFYCNDRVCNNILPGIACDLLPVCRHGSMNEDNYTIREKKVKL